MQIEKDGPDRIVVAGYIIVIGFIILLLRLWQLQIIQGDEFREISESNRLRVINVQAPRGIIFDRNGIPLVKNTPYFIASVIPGEFDSNNVDALSKILDIPSEEISGKISIKKQNPFTTIRIKKRLSFREVSVIEARRTDFPGLIIEIAVSRDYIYGKTGAHAIGYLGKLTPGQLEDPEYKDLPRQAFIGQWGVEKYFDKTLRGISGQKIFEVDALGREIRLIQEKPPVKGDDITLSLDIELQKEGEKSFEGLTGALVALQPETGEILGLVSSPSFDPNKFANGISYADWTAITRQKNMPMLNRALQSQYPPGSTFKIITAIAALEEGIIDTTTEKYCKGRMNYGKWNYNCWKKKGHGSVNLHKALVESCDVYFYEVGRQLGIDKIYEYALKFGLGRETGILLGSERKGLIPNTRWKMATKNAPWFLGETIISSIGQGYVSTTPIQMAVMMSAITNGGIIYRPVIIKGMNPVPLGKIDVKPETLKIIRDSLVGVVDEPDGTGQAAKSAITTIGGKTGTAQVVGTRQQYSKNSKNIPEKYRDHAWFIAFAPGEKAEIALSVFVEHGGHGGSTAAPIAKKVIEAYMLQKEKQEKSTDVQN